MNVIRHAADSLGVCVQAIDDAAKIGVEFVPPFLVEDGFAVFRREDEMVMQAGMGGGHAETGLAPLPGCGVRGDLVPVVSPAGAGSTTGYRMGCLRHRQSRLPHLDPSRIGACSRWLSAATPPDDGVQNGPHPGGMPSRSVCSIEVTRIEIGRAHV